MSQFSKRSWLFIVLAMICCSLFSTGCKEPSDPVGTLTGIITSNGEVLAPDCRVRVYHPSSDTTRAAVVGDDGRYTFKDFALGDYKLAVLQKPSYDAVADPFDKRVPQKYRSVNTSGFEYTIKEGMNEYDLKLEY